MTFTTIVEETAAAELKQVHRATWAAGDYPAVAEHIERVPPTHLLSKIGISPEHGVLDVATGSGNVALRAAATGAEVTGLDLVPELLAVAEQRAAEAGVEIEFVAGDAEALPFADVSFDRVLSVFGVQFAPRHRLAAEELVRVCHPGGAIGLVCWTPEGLIGQMFAILSRYLPAPPPFASAPPLWGSEEHVTELFADSGLELEFERATNPFVFPSVDEYMTFFEERYGPSLKTKEKLTAEGTWEQCRGELRELYESLNRASDGSVHLESEYLLTIARKG
jgi:ubiquinone/menaquinone biosynthesis C-methylase UbiE